MNYLQAKPEEEKKLAPPPTASFAQTQSQPLAPSNTPSPMPSNTPSPVGMGDFASAAGMSGDGLSGGNVYSAKNAKKRGARSRYVDVMNTNANDDDTPKVFLAPPVQSFQPLQPMQPMQPMQPGESVEGQAAPYESQWN